MGIGVIYLNTQDSYLYYGGVFTFVRGKENVTFIDITPNMSFDTNLQKETWGALYFNAGEGSRKVHIWGV